MRKGFVILVDFAVKPGKLPQFRALIDENAIASVRDEPGCRRFDVMQHGKDPNRVLLYEIYDDRDSFAAHLKTPHFAAFNQASADFVADKTITECDLVCEGSAA
jgi:quinol monooxygenase YgiN